MKKIFLNNSELEELIEESYSYYSFLYSKNPNNLTNYFDETCSSEVNIKLERLKKLFFTYGYIKGIKEKNT